MDSTTIGILQKLQSSTVGLSEKYKLLNTLLREAKKSSAVAEQVLQATKAGPTNFYLTKLRFDLIVALQRVDLLADLFKTGEKTLIDKISKKGQLSWAFQSPSSPFLDGAFLVKEFFPNVPYVCRLKIINQLARFAVDEAKCEQLFETIQAAFGLRHAAKLLPNCSSSFIERILAKNRIRKASALLIPLIAKKHPQVAFNYLKDALENAGKITVHCTSGSRFTGDLYPIMGILAHKDLIQFLDLYEAHHHQGLGSVDIGHLSRHITRDHLERALKSPKIYADLLKPKDVIRLERSDLMTFLTPLMPAKPADVTNYEFRRVSNIISKMPTNVKVYIFNKLLEKAYPGRNVVKEIAGSIGKDLVPYFRPEDRLLIAERHLENVASGGSEIYYWLPVKPVSKSIPELKQLLFIATDPKERERLVQALLETCSINEDADALLEIIKFVVERYRNDRIELLGSFASNIENFPNLMKLSTKHWGAINSLVQICLLHPDKDKISWRLLNLLHKLFVASAERNLPVDPIIEKIYELCQGYSSYSYIIQQHEHGQLVQRKFLEAAANSFCKKFGTGATNEGNQKEMVLQVAGLFQDWNKKHRKTRVSLEQFPFLYQCIKELISSKTDGLSSYDRSRIFDIWKSDPLLTKNTFIYEGFVKTEPSAKVLHHFLLHDPSVIVANKDSIFKYIIERWTTTESGRFMESLKVNCYPDLYNALVEYCVNRLSDSEANLGRVELKDIFRVLSIFKSSEAYVDIVKTYIPSDPKIDLQKENMQQQLLRTESAVRSLVHIDKPALGLDVAKLFCVGDYLKYSRDALYSLCMNSPVSTSLDFISKMLDTPVSLKKHVIRIILTLTPETSKKVALLQGLWKNEKNTSIRAIIVGNAIDLLLHEATEAEVPICLDFFSTQMIPSLNFNDKEAIQFIIGYMNQLLRSVSGKAQDRFLLAMFSKAFETKDDVPLIERMGQNMKLNLIQVVGENYSKISKEVVMELARNYFFSDIESGVENLWEDFFVRLFLLHDEKSTAEVLPIIMNRLEQVLAFDLNVPTSEKRSKKEERKLTLRKNFGRFFSRFCSEAISLAKNKNIKEPQGKKFIALLEKIYNSELFAKNATQTFDERFWVEMAIIVLRSENCNIRAGKGIGAALDAHLKKYGKDILELCRRNLKTSLAQSELNTTESKLRLVQGIINFPSETSMDEGDGAKTLISTERRMTALELFPAQCPDEANMGIYTKISNILLKPQSEVEGFYITNWKNANIQA